MAYIETVPPEDADGVLADIYRADEAHSGYIPNYDLALSLRPEVIAAWRSLIGAIRSNMDLRRYELATVAAAKALRSSYCMLAHGSVLRAEFHDDNELRAIVIDHRRAGLDPADVVLMDFAEKVTLNPSGVTQNDIAQLRGHGFSDEDILDITLAAAARNFFSRVIDAVGAEPDAAYLDLDESLRSALVVGRPIEGTAPAE